MPAELHDLQAVQGDVPDDLSRLPSLEEERVRNALQKRFERNQIYTHINSLLGARRVAFLRPAENMRGLSPAFAGECLIILLEGIFLFADPPLSLSA